jgi:hypothetical protein
MDENPREPGKEGLEELVALCGVGASYIRGQAPEVRGVGSSPDVQVVGGTSASAGDAKGTVYLVSDDLEAVNEFLGDVIEAAAVLAGKFASGEVLGKIAHGLGPPGIG